MKMFLKSSIVVFFLMLVFGCFNVCATQEDVGMSIYNRGELVNLSDELIYENDEYFISAEDLSKLNLKYTITYKEVINDEFIIYVFSEDAYGRENELRIDVSEEKLGVWNPNANDGLGGYVEEQNNYICDTSMSSKKIVKLNYPGLQTGSELLSIRKKTVVIKNEKYYISLNAIAQAISYEYYIENNAIYLWITDSEHVVLNGNISLPEGETAPEGGVDVDILLRNGKNTTFSCASKIVNIPENESSVYYFIETEVLDADSDKYVYALFDFDSDYKAYSGNYRVTLGNKLDITTESVEKVPFSVNLYMPDGLTANDDIYGIIHFENYGVYLSDEPLIKKGESQGKITTNIDANLKCDVSVINITGDDRVFPYGYYNVNGLRVVDDTTLVCASDEEIDICFIKCNKISGTVISPLDNNRYIARISGYSIHGEKIYLRQLIDDGMQFEFKVPCSLNTYDLSVGGNLRAYCYYVNDSESTYKSSSYHHKFSNNQNYSDIKLNYEPFYPKYPISLNARGNSGDVYLGNLSDFTLDGMNLYCAIYNEGNKLLHILSQKIDKIEPYVYEQYYSFDYPTDFYKADKVKFFVWDENLSPKADEYLEFVNRVSIPERDMLILTANDNNAVFCDKKIKFLNAPVIENNTMYVAEEVLNYMGFGIKSDIEAEEIYLQKDMLQIGFKAGQSALVYSSDDELYDIYEINCPFVKNGVMYISIEDVAKIFEEETKWYNDTTIMVNNDISDIYTDNPYFDAIVSMYYRGVVVGYEDKTFKPDKKAMRCEAAAMICRLLGYECTSFRFSCTDVPESFWASSYIGICINEGIFELENDNFRHYYNITVNELVNALGNLCEENEKIELLNNVNTDNMDRDITRGECAQIMYNFSAICNNKY